MLPLTLGSIRKLRPVISATAFTTASMSALTKFSVTASSAAGAMRRETGGKRENEDDERPQGAAGRARWGEGMHRSTQFRGQTGARKNDRDRAVGAARENCTNRRAARNFATAARFRE